MSFIQVGGQTHQTHLRQAEVSQLDVTHGCNQEAGKRNGTIRFEFSKLSLDSYVESLHSLMKTKPVLLVGLEVTVYNAVVV